MSNSEHLWGWTSPFKTFFFFMVRILIPSKHDVDQGCLLSER